MGRKNEEQFTFIQPGVLEIHSVCCQDWLETVIQSHCFRDYTVTGVITLYYNSKLFSVKIPLRLSRCVWFLNVTVQLCSMQLGWKPKHFPHHCISLLFSLQIKERFHAHTSELTLSHSHTPQNILISTFLVQLKFKSDKHCQLQHFSEEKNTAKKKCHQSH